jgi:DNA-binding NarL/FixJ family response regulator
MPGTGLRLLIVEDQELMAMTIAAAVRRLNYDLVGSAATAARALELAESCRPDVVLMDLHLKGITDGVATAREIVARTGARIVFLTGSATGTDVARMQAMRPAGIIFKPFRRTELASKLAAAAQDMRSDDHGQEGKAATHLTSIPA